MKNAANITSLLSLLTTTVGFLFFIKTNTYLFLIIGLLLSLILDGLDGKIARKYSADDQKGQYVDSLVDVIVFCFIPFLAILSVNETFAFFLAGFFYVCMGILRLARFHVLQSQNIFDFIGLPTTISGIIFISLCGIFNAIPIMQSISAIILGILMYSNIKIKKVKI